MRTTRGLLTKNAEMVDSFAVGGWLTMADIGDVGEAGGGGKQT
jgi:hypothetical protein